MAPGGRPHQNHPVFLQQGNDGFGVRRAAREEHGRHVLLLDQLARIFGSILGIKFVVQRHQFDLLAIHAAPAFTVSIQSLAPSWWFP